MSDGIYDIDDNTSYEEIVTGLDLDMIDSNNIKVNDELNLQNFNPYESMIDKLDIDESKITESNNLQDCKIYDSSESQKTVQFVICKNKINKGVNELDSLDSEKIINYIDKAVYCYLRRFMNKSTNSTFVSIDKISRDFGLSRPTINKSIDKLIKFKLIKKDKRGRGYEYTFTKIKKDYTKISFELLDMNIPPKLKAFCIAIQEYLLLNEDKKIGVIRNSSTDIAKLLGMSCYLYRKYLKECKQYNIILNDFDKLEDLRGKEIQFDLETLGQYVVYIGQQVEKNTKKTDKLEAKTDGLEVKTDHLESRIYELEKELNKLKQQFNNK